MYDFRQREERMGMGRRMSWHGEESMWHGEENELAWGGE